MACKAIQMWTFSTLVGAFLDLAIVYLLLCASTAAYFASKFLSVFGLSLPCPCNGVFGHPDNNSKCVQSVLVDSPMQKISTLHASVRSKAPIDMVSMSGQNSEINSNLGRRSIHESSEDEASCSLSSQKRLDHSSMKNVHDMHFRISDSCITKGNVADSWNERSGLLHHRRGSIKYQRCSSVPWQDSILLDSQYLPFPPTTVNLYDENCMKSCNDMQQECHMEVSNDKETPKDINLQENTSPGSNMSINDSGDTSEYVSTAEGSFHDGLAQINSSHSYTNEKNISGALESALQEERVAHANLCIELEKERNAAATAADEAMAMILRLQEEKASIEMEARQFQRMVEEKSAFDAEEMNIMTEILLRREKEKYFLDKEVEAYRQMIFANEQLDSDLEDTAAAQEEGACSILSSTEKAEPMLQKIRKSIDQEELGSQDEDTPASREVMSINCENSPASFSIMSLNSPLVDEHDSHEKSMKRIGNEGEESKNTIVGEYLGLKSEQPLGSPQISTSNSTVVMGNDRKGLNIKRSSSDTIAGFQENSSAQPKNPPSNLRRKSMSSFDDERIKIDNEVGWLRERLKFVQKGRQRLNFSTMNLEGGKAQLQLLEDIAIQLQKIRRLRDPGKAERQASLPPLSSKV